MRARELASFENPSSDYDAIMYADSVVIFKQDTFEETLAGVSR
jgi:hypothetical protein